MKRIVSCLCTLAMLGAGALLGGCTAADPAESSLPQARPATWEGAPPVASGSQGRSGY